MEWQPIETAPKDGVEVMLYYEDWLGQKDMVISGHWDEKGQDSTWEHSLGYGDADMWMPLPAPPKATE